MNYPLFFTAFLLLIIDWIILLIYPKENKYFIYIEKGFRLIAFSILFIWLYLHSRQLPELNVFTIAVGLWGLSLFLALFNEHLSFQFLSKSVLLLFYIVFSYRLLQYRSPVMNLPLFIVLVLIVSTSFQVLKRLYFAIKSSRYKNLSGFILIFGIGVSIFLFTSLVTYTQGVAWRDRTALFLGLGGTFAYTAEVIYAWNLLIRPLNKGNALYSILSSFSIFCLTLGVVTKAVLITL